jgi:opacity protein-like surface antigen
MSAAEEDDYSRSGFYMGVGPSLVVPLFDDEVADWRGAPSDVDHSVGILARIGLRTCSFFSAELQYEGVKGYDVEMAGEDHFRMDSHSVTVGAKLHLPLWRIQPYLLAGIGFTHYDIHDVFVLTEDRTFTLAGRLGGGLDFYLTKNLVINGEVTVMLTDGAMVEQGPPPPGPAIDPMHYLSAQIGLIYRF